MNSLKNIEDVSEFIQSLAVLSKKLSSEESNVLPLLVEGIKLYLKTVADDRLTGSTRGCLLQFSSDCTPQKARAQYFKNDGSLVWRGSAQSTYELYVQQLFGTTFAPDGSLRHFIVFREPQVLKHGKGMAALLACTMGFPGLSTLVRPRPDCITIVHTVQDRGMAPSYRHAFSGWVSEQGQKAEAVPGAQSGADVMCWHTDAPCCLHAAHNAVKWAAEQLLASDPGLWKELHIAMLSYRSCMHAAASGLGSWLCKVVEGKDTAELPSSEELRSLYASLGLSASLLDTACEEMRLTWHQDGSRLLVLNSFLVSDGSIGRLSVLLLSVWKMQVFTFSRCLTVGTSCRQLALASVTGFLDFMAHLRHREYVTQYESAGALHMNSGVLRVAVMLGYIAYAAESLIGLVLGDGRLLRVLPEVQESIMQELEFFGVDSFQCLGETGCDD